AHGAHEDVVAAGPGQRRLPDLPAAGAPQPERVCDSPILCHRFARFFHDAALREYARRRRADSARGSAGRRQPGQPRWRWNGISKTAAKPRAKSTASGTIRATASRNDGAPGPTRPATTFSYTT